MVGTVISYNLIIYHKSKLFNTNYSRILPSVEIVAVPALADYLGVERSGLSAEIGKMKREGIINSEKNRFELL